ncbi:MAG TPA: DUF4012 domain-containing protein, partial [Brevibacterium sp.]|nr:DUF4012 domain-containing protein [Brevibacterium sp.]
TGNAREALSGPHWSVAARLPLVGPNVVAARTATEVVDDLATDVLPDLVAATEIVEPARLAPQEGRIDLAPFIEVAPQVTAAHDAVRNAQQRLGEIEPERIFELLRDPLSSLQGQLDDVASLTATASRAVQLIPPMLGAEEPRDYILMVQNNSEPRSTGGLTGAFLHLRADDGAIELLEQRSAVELGSFPEPAVPLTDTEVALFGTQLGRYPGNVTATPHFPRSAEIITTMWRERVGDDVDGVFSLDPVALGAVLEATEPIEVPEEALWELGAPAEFLGDDTHLTADNVADLMLNGVYRLIAEPSDQDEFFELAAAGIFSQAMSGGADPGAMIAALVQAADEGRVHVWSAHEAEQQLLSGTVLSGELRGDDGNGAPVVGVYVNDLSAAKVAFYQNMDVELVAEQCHANGAQDLTVRVTLSSDAPEDAEDLPESLVGTGRVVPKGDMRSNLLVYAPTGGRITDVRDPDGDIEAFPQIHEGQVVVGRRVVLSPGDTVTTELDITTGPGFTADAILRTTPGPGNERFTSSALTCRQ